MSVRSLILLSPGLVLIGLVVGLALSFAFRRKPWIVFIWLPTVGTFAYGTSLLLRRLGALGGSHGPEAAFDGLALIVLLPALAICIGGLIVGYFARPLRNAWRFSTAIAAVILYLASFFLSDREEGTHFSIEVSDLSGKHLAQTRAELKVYEDGLEMEHRILTSNNAGRLTIQLKHNQQIELQFQPMPVPPIPLYRTPTFWNLNIEPSRDLPDQLVIRHSWQRPVGGVVLNEGFTEIVRAEHNIHIPLVLPPHESLEAGPRRDKIHALLVAFQKSIPKGLSHSSVCRNVESIEFIPLIIETYRQNEPERDSAVDGLAGVAGVLSELDKGCNEVMRRVRFEPYYPKDMLSYQVTQLCTWAKVPPEQQMDQINALGKVQEKIAAHAQQLVDFVFERLPSDAKVIKILSELRRLGHSSLQRLIVIVHGNPPKDIRSVYQWSHPLWMIGAHFSDLESIYASHNPLLVMLAFEATPNNEVKGPIAAKALERLEAVFPQMDEGIRPRAEMHIKMLKARLK